MSIMKRPQLSFKCTKILPFTPIFMYILIENVYISASKKGLLQIRNHFATIPFVPVYSIRGYQHIYDLSHLETIKP